ncbi:SnoaL-like domain protein [Tautonia plasticadhaerens]|uniref:SnoaL-like domain protein n=2 Tax=Tautonia plasticadhaerens TaxID=2527974 RepID=A0A518GUR9_9BACT|nr:SnoaL-like domain protein [Tautonia plasticadhaerens]
MNRPTPSRAARLTALATLAALLTPDVGPACPVAPTAERPQENADVEADTDLDSPEARREDRESIRAAMRSFEAAFEARDAEALASHWTAQGEYLDEGGKRIRGRAALRAGFAAFFAATPEVTAEVRPGPIRFLSDGTAIEEGAVAVRRGPAEPETRAAYSALLVREGGRWLMAQLEESPGGGPSVGDLAWLVGEWRSAAGEAAEIRTTYEWAPGEAFLQAKFTLKERAMDLGGTQVIGHDPETGALHSWTFEAGGGIGEADWHPDGDHWVLEAAGTLTDGRTLFETNILRRVDDDTFTWQSIGRLLEDVELPDLPPVKVTRVEPQE